jgi:FHA domain
MPQENKDVMNQPDSKKPDEEKSISDQQTQVSGGTAPKPKQTEMLSLPDDFQPKPMPHREPLPNTTRLSAGWRIIFRIGDQKKALNIEELITIGRGVESEDTNAVDFDLTPFGAYHFGVSRKHAIMTLKDGYLYLEDLGSTNGTRINGFQLTANQKYRLRDGDEIEFARLRTSIRFRNPDQP